MTLIYDVKVIPLILFNSLLFYQTHDKRWKKIERIVPEIFDVFTFSILPILHVKKED